MTYDELIIEESKKRYALQTERDAFLDGVQYCEDNPAWRMCEEDKMPEELQTVLVGTDKGIVLTGVWREEDGWCLNTLYPRAFGKVIAWLPLPIPPKFNHESK